MSSTVIDLNVLTARRAGELVAGGETSCVELVEATLARIERTEGLVAAYVHVAADEALAEARARDDELAAGRSRGPLHGVPFAAKDVLDAAGLPCASGSQALAGRVPERDSSAVRLLREAGCVLVGKLVTTEMAMRHTEPKTRNPWDPALFPGGSSSGSGAAVAAGTALIALGTDAGGSARLPAALCGVVAIRPTTDRVPTDGFFPCVPYLDTIGPLARTVEDCALALDALSGSSAAARLDDPVAGLRIGVDRAFLGGVAIDDDVAQSFEAALAALAAAGCEIVELDVPELALAGELGPLLLSSGGGAVAGELARTSPEGLAPGTRDALLAGAAIPQATVAAALADRRRLQAAFGAALGSAKVAALATPTTPGTGYTHRDISMGSSLTFARFTVLANLLGSPAVSVPSGLTPAGLPVGLLLTGPEGTDETLLTLARHYERASAPLGCPPLVAGRP